jgi:hypothetical protein
MVGTIIHLLYSIHTAAVVYALTINKVDPYLHVTVFPSFDTIEHMHIHEHSIIKVHQILEPISYVMYADPRRNDALAI